jgi:hypothetical protein
VKRGRGEAMNAKAAIPALIVFITLTTVAIYFAIDALNNMSKSLQIQKQFKPICGGVEIVNCTAIALRNIYESAQHLLIAVVELLASAIFAILAIYTIKMWIELSDELR